MLRYPRALARRGELVAQSQALSGFSCHRYTIHSLVLPAPLKCEPEGHRQHASLADSAPKETNPPVPGEGQDITVHILRVPDADRTPPESQFDAVVARRAPARPRPTAVDPCALTAHDQFNLPVIPRHD
jgi:hypothetical protein